MVEQQEEVINSECTNCNKNIDELYLFKGKEICGNCYTQLKRTLNNIESKIESLETDILEEANNWIIWILWILFSPIIIPVLLIRFLLISIKEKKIKILNNIILEST